jgi:hypothetical protein
MILDLLLVLAAVAVGCGTCILINHWRDGA